MALNASGPISLAGATSGQSIALELGRASNTTTSLNESSVRTLLGVASGAISLSNAYGKSNAPDPGAGVDTAGAPILYNFNNSTESWTSTNANLVANTTYVSVNATAADPSMTRTVSFSGKKYPYVEVYLFRTNGTTGWDGSLYYTTSGHGQSELYKGLYTQPTWDGVNYQYMIVDMRSQLIGAPDWTNSTITSIRLDFGLTSVDDFRVDWIQLRGTIYPSAGLYQRSKAGYHNEVATYMDSGTTDVGAVNTVADAGVPTTTTYSYVGYFLAPTTGTYRFAINTDDGGYLWVGTNAVSGYTTSNASANYGGLHAASGYVYTPYYTLTAGVYYPIRMITGNNAGNGAAYLAFEGPGIALTNAGTGYYFYNVDTTGI